MIRFVRDIAWAEACLLGGVAAAAASTWRGSLHSQRYSPALALLPALIIILSRSSLAGRLAMTGSAICSRLWILNNEKDPMVAIPCHVIVIVCSLLASLELRGAIGVAFILVTAGWPPLPWYTAAGHPQEAIAAAGVLLVQQLRLRWRVSVNGQRLAALGLFVLLMLFGGSEHITLMVYSLAAFCMVQPPPTAKP